MGWDLNPRYAYTRTAVFKTAAFNCSATHPVQALLRSLPCRLTEQKEATAALTEVRLAATVDSTRPPFRTWDGGIHKRAVPQAGAGERAMPTVSPSEASTATAAGSAGAGSHLVINVSYDSTLTALNTPGNAAYNPTVYQGYTSAIQTAVQFYENTFTNPIAINLVFGWGEVDGDPITGFAAQSNVTSANGFTYAQVYNAVKATETTSAVQIAAVASLPSSDPTNRATFLVFPAEAKALGLAGASGTTDGFVGLNSSDTFSWSQSSIASGTEDAVSLLEHEISGRHGQVGQCLTEIRLHAAGHVSLHRGEWPGDGCARISGGCSRSAVHAWLQRQCVFVFLV